MGRKKRYDRQDVLNKAMGLFWQQGYQATSMAEMTQATGLNTASMYKEFGDKDGLFEGALEPEAPNMQGVVAFLENVACGAAREEYKGCLMMNHLAQKHAISQEAAEMIDDFCAAMEGLLETALRNAQSAGDLSNDKDPAVLASYIMCCVHGLVLYGRHQNKKGDIPKLYGTMVQAVLA
jgi:AcrR family transcriptional regulator